MTFLFTDIQGSTRMWESDADGMRAALAVHDHLMRSVVQAHRGEVFKHTGDGVCAVFDSARDAIEAAVAAQRQLELPVRMGVASGEVQQRDDDYFGPALNRAARVMGAGHGGQIVVSDSAAALVTGVDLVDLGEHRLRDLAASVRLYQVRADGLETTFPALRTLDATPGNLPVQVTSFVGREVEVKQVGELVQAHRLVTLTGAGGVGKTRLSVQVAAELTHEFTDGVWVVELATISDPAAVPDAMATVLGVTAGPGGTVTESIVEALSGRRLLVVVDNCEHVLSAAADLVDAILSRATTVRVLATSREGLGLAAEHRWPVPPLDARAGPGRARGRALPPTSAGRATPVLARRSRRGRGGDRDLPAPRWDRPRHRAGRRPHGVDECPGGARPPRRSLPTPLRHRTGPAAPPDPARGGVVVLRPARGRRAEPARPVLRCSPAGSGWPPRCTSVRTLGWIGSPCSTCSTRWCASP